MELGGSVDLGGRLQWWHHRGGGDKLFMKSFHFRHSCLNILMMQ